MVVPKIILQGDDQRKATKWIPWAKKRLQALKSLPGLGIVNNSFRPSPDVDVRVKSVNGIDTIRIKTYGGEYSCEFPDVVPCSPCSDFQLICPAEGVNAESRLKIGFRMRTAVGYWDNYHWDFGDGNTFDGGDFTGGFSLDHVYDKPGEYTVSVTATRGIVTTFQNGTAQPGSVHKIGSSTTSIADAYADWLSAVPNIGSWSNVRWDVNAEQDWHGNKSWQYESMETVHRFDLTAIALGSTVELYMQGVIGEDIICHWPVYGDPCSVIGLPTGIQSSLGGSLIPSSTAPGTQLIEDSSVMNPLIGGIIDITFTDTGGNSAYLDYMIGIPPHPLTRGNFYGHKTISPPVLKIQTPGESATTTKVIRVNSGRPKKTRQIGESVHT